MARQRRVVVDTSAIVPAIFPGRNERINRHAASLIAAMNVGEAVAFAPDMLQIEFLGLALRRLDEMSERGRFRSDVEVEVRAQWEAFLRVPIVYTPAGELAERAFEACTRHSVPPPDIWFIACALHHDAQLWLSHPHADRAGDHARSSGVDVRYLTEGAFR